MPVEQVKFPVVLIIGSSPRDQVAHEGDVYARREHLSRMRVERYTGIGDQTLSDPPIVIDSDARIFNMTEIEGAHGSLWMMMNPTGMMPITFKLVERKERGLDAARALIAQCEYLGSDLDGERRLNRIARMAGAETMAEVMALVEEMPPHENELPR